MRLVIIILTISAMSASALAQNQNDRMLEGVGRGMLEALFRGLNGGNSSSGGNEGISNKPKASSDMYVKFTAVGKASGLFMRDIGPLVSKVDYGYFPHKNASYNRVYRIPRSEWNKVVKRISSDPYWTKSKFGSGYQEPTGTTSRSPLVIEVRQPDIRATDPDGRRYGNPLGKGGGSAGRFKRDTENSARDAGKQLERFFTNPFGN
jgi:hypothetical protein